jgi:adenine-specific DNA-methyltransferase
MPITKLTPENSYPYLQDRLEQLEQAVPEAFADGKVNWDTLREVLNADLENEDRDEYFGLNWPGKREARKRAATPSYGTLVPAPGEGVNEDTTENLFIEGDNLEVLKLLQKSYAGKIKMIYIDPPYNTGNDFIYNDDFTDPLAEYLKYTGATGEGGELLTTNTRADGRFHSKWLNMMYPRLILACQLLREDGIIFVSIDDNEVHNLRQMMNEIFGEENFMTCIIWEKRYTRSNNAKLFGSVTEYILLYRKSSSLTSIKEPRNQKADSIYSNPDNDPRGDWTSVSYVNPALKADRPNLVYEIFNPNTGKYISHPTNAWKYSKSVYEQHASENRLLWGSKGENIYPRLKVFLNEMNGGMVPSNLWSYEETGTTDSGSNELLSIFGEKVFDFPKPSSLVSRMLGLISLDDNESIVLDFFSGSGTTAQAVINTNVDKGNKFRFILVQIPENTENKKFTNIAEIGKERIRRVIKEKEKELLKKAEEAPLLQEDQPKPDLGFKVSKYTHSNFKQWKVLQEESIDSVTPLFDDHSDSLVQGWKKEDLLSEIFLLEGYPLTSKVTFLEDNFHNQVYRVTAPDFCDHDLFVCLDETIQPATIDLLKMEKEDIFICLDNALSDELKARVQDKFNVHVI